MREIDSFAPYPEKATLPTSDYYKSFDLPDRPVVDPITRFYKNGRYISEIVVQAIDGERAIVWTANIGQKRVILRQINWNNPLYTPDRYIGFNTNFFDFDGPAEKQIHRAQLLSEGLGIPLIWLDNNLEYSRKDPEYGWINTSIANYRTAILPK